MLLVAFVSPAALALFNRGVALFRQIAILIQKISTMFVPITSSLIGMKKKEEARGLLIQSNQMSMCLTLPGVILLCMFGDVILGVWMGEDYAYWPLMITLGLGAIVPIGTSGTHSVMAGFNVHGKMVLYGLLITIVTLLFGGIIAHSFGWSILSVSILCSVAWSLGKFITMPYFLRKNFRITYLEFFKDGMLSPMVKNIPLLALMGVARVFYEQDFYLLMVLSMLLGFSTTFYIYWTYQFTDSMRKDVKRVLKLSRKKNSD